MVQKWPFKALFWEIRLADTELAATRSYRQIEAERLVFQKKAEILRIKKNQNYIYLIRYVYKTTTLIWNSK